MPEISTNDQKILEQLHRHPHLRDRIESLLRIAEDSEGDLEKADAAEQKIIQEIRQMGNELLTGWANTRINKTQEELSTKKQYTRAGKKKFTGTAHSA
jgi:membrane-bound ClpP family serine protease